MVHKGITPDNAIQILLKADTDEKKETAVQKIESDRRAGFDWIQFWSQSDKAVQTLPDRFKTRILSLSSQSCTPEAFEEFAQLALKLNTGFEFVYGDKKTCGLPVSNKSLKGYLDHFLTAPSISQKDFAQFLVSQYSFSPNADRLNLLKSLSGEHWANLVSSLIQKGDAHLAAQVVQINQSEFGINPFLNRIVLEWLKDPQTFEALVEKNNLLDLLNLVTQDPSLASISKSIPESVWETHLETLKNSYQKSVINLSYDDNLRVLHLFEVLPTRMGTPPAFGKQLLWIEKNLRILEQALLQGQVEMDSSSGDLITLWLKHRNNEDFKLDSAMTSSNPLQLALYKKLELWSSANSQFASQLAQYCQWLKIKGVEKRDVIGDDWVWSMTEEPGCIEVHGPTQLEKTKTVEMAFDSVVLTNGQPMKLKAQKFDGSFLNFSTPAVPFVIGFQVKAQVLKGPGTYYVKVDLEKTGLFSLSLEIFENSHLPRVVYKGSQVSKILDWDGFKKSLLQTHGYSDDASAQPQVIEDFNSEMRSSLFDSATKDENGMIRLFIEPDRLNRFLPGVCFDKRCWNELGLAAAEQLNEDSESAQLVLEKQ